jgi:hypothetical protein
MSDVAKANHAGVRILLNNKKSANIKNGTLGSSGSKTTSEGRRNTSKPKGPHV